MRVVTDTGPLNYLILIGQVTLLPALFETVWVPEPVSRELRHREAPALVREWIDASPPWLCVEPMKPTSERELISLGEGESASIELAESLRADLLLMDDRLGVVTARARGLNVTGTLGVLERGAGRGWVDLADAFRRLQETSFRVRAALLEDILSRHKSGGFR